MPDEPMTDKIVRAEPSEGAPAERVTIVKEERSRGMSGTLVTVLVLLALTLVAFLVFGRVSDSEVAMNNAVTGAADQVGNAAQQVGNAAEDAADNLAK